MNDSEQAAQTEKILRIRDVCAIVGLSEPSVWRMVRDGTFPAPRKIGSRARGWLQSEVFAHLRALPKFEPAA